jgi:hypothetical protein
VHCGVLWLLLGFALDESLTLVSGGGSGMGSHPWVVLGRGGMSLGAMRQRRGTTGAIRKARTMATSTSFRLAFFLLNPVCILMLLLFSSFGANAMRALTTRLDPASLGMCALMLVHNTGKSTDA